jgi:hypothetical protein
MILCLQWFTQAIAQPHLTLHRLEMLSQRNGLNPALFFDGTASIGLPLISNTYALISHSAFSYADLVRQTPDDSLRMDTEHMLSHLQPNNRLSIAAGTDLWHIGFKIKNNFFAFNITEKLHLHFEYNRQLMQFLVKGNAAFIGETIPLQARLWFEHRRDYAFTYATKINRRLTAGIRIKRLYGMENISMREVRVAVYTDPATLAITAQPDIQINTSGIESHRFDDLNISQYLFDRNNWGWAVDVGFHYQLNDRWSMDISALDIGSIRWQSLVDNYQSSHHPEAFTYHGIDLNQFFNDTATADQVFQRLLDTLTKGMTLQHTHHTYQTALPVQNYTSITYRINERHTSSLLFHLICYPDNWQMNSSMQYRWNPLRWLELMTSFSLINKNQIHIGLGLCMSPGSYQIYLMSDSMQGIFFPHRARHISGRAGINFIFGRKDTLPRQKNTDVPSSPVSE